MNAIHKQTNAAVLQHSRLVEYETYMAPLSLLCQFRTPESHRRIIQDWRLMEVSTTCCQNNELGQNSYNFETHLSDYLMSAVFNVIQHLLYALLCIYIKVCFFEAIYHSLFLFNSHQTGSTFKKLVNQILCDY